MNYDICGHKAFVTGSSRGIGSAIALELAKGGADVIVHSSKPSEKADMISEQIRKMGRNSTAVAADLTDIHEVQKLADELKDIDILVLNASVQIKEKWQDISTDNFIKQVNCNYFASFILLQKLALNMQEKKWGRIITIGSVQEKKPHPEMLVYSSSKCAQTGLMLSLASQLAPYGITVNNVAPGVIYTDRNKEALNDVEYAQKVMQSIPLKMYGEKEDIAGTVRLLCSDFGRYITGQSIYIDGGKSL